MKDDPIVQVWDEFISIQEEIKQLSQNVKIKSYSIKNDIVRYCVKEWLKHNGFTVMCEGNKIYFDK